MNTETIANPAYFPTDAVVIEQTYVESENIRKNYCWGPKEWEEEKNNSSITVAVFHIKKKEATHAAAI